MIKLNNVSKNFDNNIVLKDLNLEIKKGSVVGLVGANGSGKSTLLRLLSGVIETDTGSIHINDKDIYNNPEAKKEVFFLADDPYFFSQSTISDIQKFYEVFYKDFDETIFTDLLLEFNLDPDIKINSFSKGMKRQVSVILAFACQSEILLLDEAFDGLDPLMRFKLRQYIGDKTFQKDGIVIISSHNLRELEDICDSILIIDDHKVKMNHSTQEYNDIYHRFQVAFHEPFDERKFDVLNPLNVNGKEQLFTLILKGDKNKLKKKIDMFNPLINEHSSVSLEEIYLYELEEKSK